MLYLQVNATLTSVDIQSQGSYSNLYHSIIMIKELDCFCVEWKIILALNTKKYQMNVMKYLLDAVTNAIYANTKRSQNTKLSRFNKIQTRDLGAQHSDYQLS